MGCILISVTTSVTVSGSILLVMRESACDLARDTTFRIGRDIGLVTRDSAQDTTYSRVRDIWQNNF